MKKLLLTVSLIGINTFTYAQFVVIDPGDIAATIVNGGILVQTNKVIKDANEIASNIKETVHNIRELQQNIDDALWEVKALIKKDHLGISNIDFEMEATARVSTNLGKYINNIVPGDHPMIKGYGSADVTFGAEMLQDVFEYSFEEKLPKQYAQITAGSGEQIFNREVFSYASARKSIQIALSYNQLSEVMLTKAKQLNDILQRGSDSYTRIDVLKMNEAERIQLLETTASYVRKALELRLLCDQIIRKEVSREAPVQQKLLQQYRQYTVLNQLLSEE